MNGVMGSDSLLQLEESLSSTMIQAISPSDNAALAIMALDAKPVGLYHRPQRAHAKRPDMLFSNIFLKIYNIIKNKL